MAAGDITNQLTEQVRNDLQDLKKQIIPTDAVIWRKLSRWQSYFMISDKVKKVQRELDLDETADNPEQEYALDDDILTITRAYFADTDKGMDARFTIIDDSDNRRIKFFEDECYNEHVDAGDVLILDVFLKPETSDALSDTVDPIIHPDYYPYLVLAVLSEYRNFVDKEKKLGPFPHLMDLSSIMVLVKNLKKGKRSLNRYAPMDLGNTCQF